MCTVWRALPDTRGTVSRLAAVAAWRRSLESRVIPSHSVALGAPRRPFLPRPSSRVFEFPRRKEGHRSVLRDPSVRFPFVSGITRALRFWVVEQTAAEARGAHGFGDRSGLFRSSGRHKLLAVLVSPRLAGSSRGLSPACALLPSLCPIFLFL